MLETIKTFELGNTVYFECVFRDLDGSLVDPSGGTWTIKNIRGQTVASGGLLKRKLGIWYCMWTPEQVGDYILIMKGEIDGSPTVARRLFKIIETRLK